jgi:aspartate/methionine/tyrosine aminotransferase
MPLTAERRDRLPVIGWVAGERRGDTGRMRIAPFLLDRWLTEHQFATPPIEFDLAASTGPRWTWDELLSQLAPGVLEGIGDSGVSYGPAAGSPALREAIAEMAGVAPAEVVAVTGASEALMVVLLVAAEPGANVVLPHPGYPAFDELARYLGLEVRHYHLAAAAATHAVDVDEVAACLDDRTAVVIVNTPHNPTGSVVGAELLAQLRDVVADHGVQLVVDEVYHPIYHGPATPSAATLAGATTIGDMSKALCLAGLRTGWIVEHDRARLEQYVDARSYLTISNSPIDEALAAAAIRSRDTIIARAQTVAEQNLKTLDAFVAEHADLLGWVRPTGGLTALPWLRSGVDSRPFCIDAAAAGVLVAPGDCFDVPSHFRIGFGAADHGFAEAVTRLGEVLTKHG